MKYRRHNDVDTTHLRRHVAARWKERVYYFGTLQSYLQKPIGEEPITEASEIQQISKIN